MEEAVKSSKINSVYLIRPAMIKGSRNTPGILECMEPCCWFACCLCLCLPSRFHSIRIEDMARAMTLAGLMEKKGVFVLEYDEMKALFDPNP
uniref:Thioester reductase (TE) domain-containing protein n=1 Tax=Amorphochlora amoebiformis TaxID=1561963 RepID=A0A7S0H3E8_9EUKA